VPTFIGHAETGLTRDINDAFAAATGFGLEEVIGHSACWRLASPPPAAATTSNCRCVRRRARCWTALISAETVSIHGQTCVLSVLQDITERKRSEVELMAAIEAVMQDASWFGSTVIEKMAAFRRDYALARIRGCTISPGACASVTRGRGGSSSPD
jgi:hypothetical protein